MAQQSLYYNSTQRLSCDCVLPAQVYLCLPEDIVAPHFEQSTFNYHTILASVTARVPINDTCGNAYQRYTIQYDDALLVNQVPLRADQILGVLCVGCMTTWVEDTVGNDVVVVTNEDSSQTLVNQHGMLYPLVVTATNILPCEYLASSFGGQTQAAILAAIASIGSDKAKLILTCGSWTITTSMIVPANIELEILEGATLTVNAGQTFTINGAFIAPNAQVFNAIGEIVFGNGSVTEANSIWFGNDGAAIQKALNSCRAVVTPPGSYLVTTEILVTTDFQQWRANEVTLLANADNIALIRWSASDGVLIGPLKADGNSHTGVSGLRVAPVSETSILVRRDLNRNVFRDFAAANVAEGIVLVEGPYVTGVPSSCAYNKFYNPTVSNAVRGIWFKDGPNIGSNGCNENNFYSYNYFGAGNVGVDLKNGMFNSFVGGSIQGAAFGVSPLATPTAINVPATNTWGVQNNLNTFIDVIAKNNTLDLLNGNTNTGFFGCQLVTQNLIALPRVQFSNTIVTTAINFQDAFILQDSPVIPSAEVGFNFNRDIFLQNGVEACDQGFPWQAYALVLANVTNISAIANVHCAYGVFNRFAEVVLQFGFTVVNTANPLDVDLPVGCDAALYLSSPISMQFPYIALVGAAATPQLCRFSSGTKMRFYPPAGGWSGIALNNTIYASLRYRV